MNSSYKKALRKIRKKMRKRFLMLVSNWEKASNCSRYDAFFNCYKTKVYITQAPVDFSSAAKMRYNPTNNNLEKLDLFLSKLGCE